MSKHVQIRDLPLETHKKLKIRATEEGLSMSDYLKRLIAQDMKRPNWADIKAMMSKMPPVDMPETTADMIRRERDSR